MIRTGLLALMLALVGSAPHALDSLTLWAAEGLFAGGHADPNGSPEREAHEPEGSGADNDAGGHWDPWG
jgi:hypothetical protein